MKVALAHHWLVRMRGGEKVLEAIAELYPEADIFTLICDPSGISETLRRHPITTSWLNRIPRVKRFYPRLLPLYPLACRSLDLREYDLVISSDSSLIKGVRVRRDALHICYCYSPPRYLWDLSEVYLERAGLLTRAAAWLLFPWLRRWDKAAAQKVDYLIAISEHIRGRIQRHYDREAPVIYPPVDVFDPPPGPVSNLLPDGPHAAGSENDYLVFGQLVPYKRVDLAVRAFTELRKQLVIIGEGPEETRLKKMAGPTIEFLGWQPDKVVRQRLASCRALIFPGEEDFGIVPVEAQMAGRPVIAYERGGVRETVLDGRTGLFFQPQEPGALIEAIRRFESVESSFSRAECRRNALRFEKSRFLREFDQFVGRKLSERGLTGGRRY